MSLFTEPLSIKTSKQNSKNWTQIQLGNIQVHVHETKGPQNNRPNIP